MSQIEVRCHVEAPPERVFDVFSDFHNCADRIEGIQSIEVLTEGDIGVGTRFRETRVMMGKASTEEMEIVEFDRPVVYATDAESCGSQYHTEVRFSPTGSGTDVVMTFNATPLSLFAKIMGFVMFPLMKGAMKKMVQKDLDDLKRFVEAG